MKRQLSQIYANSNMLIRKFNVCTHEVIAYLFRTYCTNLYCTQFWYTAPVTFMKKLVVRYNISLRRIMNYPRYCSASYMFVMNNIPSFNELQRKLIVNFINRLQERKNTLIRFAIRSSVPLCSPMWSYWFSILHV